MNTTPILVLLHGFPLDHRIWDAQTEGLAANARVLALDLLGFGAAQQPVPEVLTMDALADDVIGRLDARGIHRAVIGGLSMGGYVALSIAERYPERVQGLVLANTRATADSDEARAGREATAQRALQQGMDVIARGMVPQLITPRTRDERPEISAQLHAMIQRQDPKAVAAASRGMAARPDRMAALTRIGVPTLIITGDADTLMPLPTSQAMAHAIPGSKLVVLPKAAHLANVEAPEAFNDAVRAFIAALP